MNRDLKWGLIFAILIVIYSLLILPFVSSDIFSIPTIIGASLSFIFNLCGTYIESQTKELLICKISILSFNVIIYFLIGYLFSKYIKKNK